MSNTRYVIFSYIFKSEEKPHVKVYVAKDDEFVESMDDALTFANYYNAFDYKESFNHGNKVIRTHIERYEAGSVSGGGREEEYIKTIEEIKKEILAQLMEIRKDLNKLVAKHEKK